MDDPNKNMEQFFRNSLDNFSERPSEMLWDRLEERLDEEKPPGFLAWLKFLLPCIFLLGFTGLFLSQRKILNDYKSQISELIRHNDKLRSEVEASAALESRISIPNITEEEVPDDEPIVQVNVRDRYKFGEGILAREVHSELSLGATPPKSSRNVISERSALLAISSLPSVSFSEDLLTSSLSTTLFQEIRLSKRHQDHSKRKRKKIPDGPIIVKQGEPWGQPGFYYRIGPSLKIQTTLKGELFSASSIGMSYGMAQEFGLTSRFAFTLGLSRAFQEYTLNNSSGITLRDELVENFPQAEDYGSQITSIEVENKFLEMPIGAKYDFYQDNIKSFFVNPTVKWSLHDPQFIRYYLTENRVHNYQGNRRFGYLNSIGLAMGIEKRISRNIRYQMSLGYEHAVEPVGEERQKLNSVNLNFNLLFGSK